MIWHELTADEIKGDADALRQRAQAYHDALLATPGRREVLADMIKSVELTVRDKNVDVMYQIALVKFIAEIKRKCGINDPLAVLAREAEVSARYESGIEPKVKRDLLELRNG